jgi:hypothetical protein
VKIEKRADRARSRPFNCATCTNGRMPSTARAVLFLPTNVPKEEVVRSFHSVSKAGCQPHAKTPPRHRAPHCTWVGRADYRNGTTSRRSSRSRSSSGWTRCAGGTRGKSGGPAKGTLGSAPFLTRRCTAKATKRTISIAKSSHAQAKVLLLPHTGATLGSEHASARRCQLRLSASSFG